MIYLVIAAILYGSLYPFDLHFYDAGQAGLFHLLSTWRNPPQSRGDLIANIFLYMPLGYAVANTRTEKSWRFAVGAVGIGAGLSFSIEWLQYYDQSRVSCLSDFYLNVLGSIAGALVSQTHAAPFPHLSLPKGSRALFARALLFSWTAWRLYPYVPAIDLHKYWNSLKPVLLYPEIDPYSAFRFWVLWSGISYLLRTGVSKSAPYLLPTAMAGYFCAKVLIVNQSLNLSEIAGAIITLFLAGLSGKRIYPAVLALLFAVVVVLSRVLPWHATAIIKPFQWVPFYSLLHGSLTVDILAFCEKIFLYGTLLLLLVEAGLPLTLACLGECITLLATSILQTRMGGRSAEITDAVIPLLLAIVYVILDRQTRRAGATC